MKISQELVNPGQYRDDNALESVTFTQNVRIIGDGAFNGCHSLRSVEFEEGVQKICGAAFFGCNALTEVRFPDSLQTIGEDAFRNCTSLQNVKISDELLRRIPEVFAGCPCEEVLNNRRNMLVARRREEEERARALNCSELFTELFNVVMSNDDLLVHQYRETCQRFADGVTLEDDDALRLLYEYRDNYVANVDWGSMNSQFTIYNNRNHLEGQDALTWERLDRTQLVSIAVAIRNIQMINEDALAEIDNCWNMFKTVVRNLSLKQVFARTIAVLCPSLVVPIVKSEAINALHDWFVQNGFLNENAQFVQHQTWIRKWLVKNNQIKRFLTSCLERQDEYGIGRFAWLFVEGNWQINNLLQQRGYNEWHYIV